MKNVGIFAVLAAQIAGLVANARHTLRRAGRTMRDTRPGADHHHGRGRRGQPGLFGKPGA